MFHHISNCSADARGFSHAAWKAVACSTILILAGSLSLSQTSPPANPDPAITATSVLGVLTSIDKSTGHAVIKTAASSEVAVALSDRTVYMRIPPGETKKEKFVRITSDDFQVGDSIFARGRVSEDRKSMPALEFYVMSKSDISAKQDRDREQWRTRGVVGVVTAINSEKGEITLESRTAEGLKPLVMSTSSDTKFRRYAPDSVKFSDAKPSTLTELKVGDQLRALGTKAAEGTGFKSEEIVSGAFKVTGGTVSEINIAANELKIQDSESRQTITVTITADSSLRQLTPELTATLTGAPAQGASPQAATAAASAGKPGETSAKTTTDVQELFDRLPPLALKDLKAGDAVIISSTKGADPSKVTAIALLNGAGSLLKQMQTSRSRGGTTRVGGLDMGGIGGP